MPSIGLTVLGGRVLQRAADDALLAHRKLQKHRRLGAARLAVRRDRKHAERHPIGLGRRDVRGTLVAIASACCAYSAAVATGCVAVVHLVVLVVHVVAVVVVHRLRPTPREPARHAPATWPSPSS